MKIPRCYDSHLHWLYTGRINSELDLRSLLAPEEIQNTQNHQYNQNKQNIQNCFRGNWLVGFGWDHFQWPEKKLPSKEILDPFFSHHPVAFTRVDGHCVWVNSQALSEIYHRYSTLDLPGIDKDASGQPTGLVYDQAFDRLQALIPTPDREQNKQFLLMAQKEFLNAGFTHVRDVGSSSKVIELAAELEQENKQQIFVEHFCYCSGLAEWAELVAKIEMWRKTPTPHNRVLGIKLFLDGALGSEGAFLSCNYQGKNNQNKNYQNNNSQDKNHKNKNNQGYLLIAPEVLTQLIEASWQRGLEVAIHSIGDAASEVILDCVEKLASKNKKGRLHIEHAEVLQEKTIQKMKLFDIVCHMQPCHYLSDQKWLKEKLGPHFSNVFRWSDLEKHQVPFFWGSDSPIEKPSVLNNWQGYSQAISSLVKPLHNDFFLHHSHPDPNWGAGAYTEFDDQLQTPKIYLP